MKPAFEPLRSAGDVRRAGLLAWVVLLLVPGSLFAQPKGPRDVITSARQQRDQQEMKSAVEAANGAAANGAAADDAAAGANPHAEDGQAPHAGIAPERKPIAEGKETDALPPGTLRIAVVDAAEQRLPAADVRVGILKSDGSRDSMSFTSNAEGIVIVPDLPVGDKQAYRAEVLADGARFSSTPFRMPHARGFEVLIRRLPTTQDKNEVVLYVGAVSVELKDERLKIAQQLRLINIGGSVFVFPEGGMQIPLPEGFTAFQTQDTMGDQRVESTDSGLKIEGSIPPGQTTLLWGFDVPTDGEEMTIAIDNPWTTFAYRVLADAAPGLTLSVDGMPPAQLHDAEGGRYWVTEAARRPEDGPMPVVRVHLAGIPGPGPYRWVATVLALLALGIGFVVSRRPVAKDNKGAADALEERKRDLMAQLHALSEDEKSGEVGPDFVASERARLTDTLSLVLWEEGQRKAEPKPS